MISSTSSSDRTVRPDLVSAPASSGTRPPQPRRDQISTESAAFLRAELARQPEIRPEVVAHARALLADPSYPPTDTIKRIAEQILNAPDLSEDQS